MYPDEIIRLSATADGIRVAVVNLFVSLPVCRLKLAEILQVVKKRPDYFVEMAVVKSDPFIFTQGYRHNLVTGIACRYSERFSCCFTCNSSPTDQGTFAIVQ